MKSLYVTLVRGVRALLRISGLLGLVDRLADRSRAAQWVRSWFAIYDLDEMMAIGVPWWTYAAIDDVEQYLHEHPGARVFEWGSGASTVWLAGRSASVVAVEHDAGWARSMAAHLPDNATIRVVPPLAVPDPVVASAKSGFEGLDFSDYVAAMADEEGRFDLVVIDGRAREACLQQAYTRLAPGGLMVFDNVDRRRYRDAIAGLGATVQVRWTRGRTPSLPYPTRTALLSRVEL